MSRTEPGAQQPSVQAAAQAQAPPVARTAAHSAHAAQAAADPSSRGAGLLRLMNQVETLLWLNRSLGKSHNPAREESRNVSNKDSRQ